MGILDKIKSLQADIARAAAAVAVLKEIRSELMKLNAALAALSGVVTRLERVVCKEGGR